MRSAVRAFVVVVFSVVAGAGAQPTRPATAPAGAVKVACVGDSITYGANIHDRAHDSYPAQLGRLLGDAYVVHNFGSNGTTALKSGDRPYADRPVFKTAVAFDPDVLVVGLGTNDTKPFNWNNADAFVADYESIVAAFKKANPAVKIYVILPVPNFLAGETSIRDHVLKDEVIPKLKRIATDVGGTTIDLRSALDGRRELFPDSIHPNPEGAGLMAAAVKKAVETP